MLLLVSHGCGDSALESLSDDSSFEAQLEEARIAIDDANYENAVRILEGLNDAYPDNKIVQQYLSNAYAGLGGLDTTDFLKTIDQLDDSGLSGSIDMIGKVIGDAGNQVLVEKQGLDRCFTVRQQIPENFGGKIIFQRFGTEFVGDMIDIIDKPHPAELARVAEMDADAVVETDNGTDKFFRFGGSRFYQ